MEACRLRDAESSIFAARGFSAIIVLCRGHITEQDSYPELLLIFSRILQEGVYRVYWVLGYYDTETFFYPIYPYSGNLVEVSLTATQFGRRLISRRRCVEVRFSGWPRKL